MDSRGDWLWRSFTYFPFHMSDWKSGRVTQSSFAAVEHVIRIRNERRTRRTTHWIEYVWETVYILKTIVKLTEHWPAYDVDSSDIDCDIFAVRRLNLAPLAFWAIIIHLLHCVNASIVQNWCWHQYPMLQQSIHYSTMLMQSIYFAVCDYVSNVATTIRQWPVCHCHRRHCCVSVGRLDVAADAADVVDAVAI